MVLLEGMSAGLPVVASRLPGFSLVMRDGVDGLMVDRPGRRGRVRRRRSSELLDDPRRAPRRWARRARERAIDTFALAGRRRPARGAVRRPARLAGAPAARSSRRREVRSTRRGPPAGRWPRAPSAWPPRRSRRAALAAAAVAGAWLYGTFDPRSRLFGAPAGARSRSPAIVRAHVRRRPRPAAHARDRRAAPPSGATGRPSSSSAAPSARIREMAAATAAAGHELASHGDDHRLLALTLARAACARSSAPWRRPSAMPPARPRRRSSARRTASAAPGCGAVASAAGYRVCAWDGSRLRHGAARRRRHRRARAAAAPASGA